MFRRLIVVVIVLIGAAVPALAQTPADGRMPATIPEMWNAWCARCHGTDGKGKVAEPTVTVEPLDFTDCRVARAEGDPDWELAIAKGGPAVGLSSQMPAFGDALKPDVIRGFVAFLRTFCGERGWPDGNLNLPRPIFTEKAFPEDELVIAPVASHSRSSGHTTWEIATIFERRIGKRFQIELVAPLASVRGEGTSGDPHQTGVRNTGLADVEVGLKTVLNPNATNHLASFGFDVLLPTGRSSVGLGGPSAVFEPYLATASAWGTTYLQTQFKLEVPADEPWRDKIGVYRFYVGKDLSVTPTGWTLGLELTGENRELALTPQVRKGLTRTGAIAGSIGVSVPLNRRDEPRTKFVGFLIWEFLEKPYFGR